MRIKKGFVLREVAGQTMVIATGEASKDFHGMLKLNATGREIWQGLQMGQTVPQIVEDLHNKFEVDIQTAETDVNAFVKKMEEMGFLVNE